ncbi:MAG: NDP-sugar synthase [Acidobacteria bacterium]|nr:NDP-sugar synthase [Acidobacteriota bacterium]
MQGLILANGKGTKLRPLTVYTPKPIVPILNKPLLLYQIEILKRAGVEQVTLFLDYQPDKIEHKLGNEEDLGVELRYVVESNPFGTAGAYKFVSKYYKETTIVVNGDILSDLVISKLLKQHAEVGSQITIASTTIDVSSSYGAIRTDEDFRVTEYFVENEGINSGRSGFKLMNAGIYIVEPGFADRLPEENALTFKYDVFPDMAKRGEDLFAFPIRDDYWCSIDSLEKYLLVQKDFLAGKVRNFKFEKTRDYEKATSAYVDEQSVIGADCVIKPNARIINSVLGKGVQVEERAVVKNSVIWPHSRISYSAAINDAIIASSCYIGKNVAVSAGSVLADKASLPDYTKV